MVGTLAKLIVRVIVLVVSFARAVGAAAAASKPVFVRMVSVGYVMVTGLVVSTHRITTCNDVVCAAVCAAIAV